MMILHGNENNFNKNLWKVLMDKQGYQRSLLDAMVRKRATENLRVKLIFKEVQ